MRGWRSFMNTLKYYLKTQLKEGFGSGSGLTPPRLLKSGAQMTLASKITVLRIIAIPFFVLSILEGHTHWAQVIFCASVLSDALDGGIARLRGERTPLGAFLDPLADKLLLVATYIAFSYLNWIPLWVFVTVISRDLLIVLGWTVVYILTTNKKIEPRPLGKMTTALQMALALARLFSIGNPFYSWLLHAMIAITVVSGADYVWIGNKRLGAIE
jgi:cardiolipin synthase